MSDIFQMPFTRQRFHVSCPYLWRVVPRLKHMYIAFSGTRGQCNSVLSVFPLFASYKPDY